MSTPLAARHAQFLEQLATGWDAAARDDDGTMHRELLARRNRLPPTSPERTHWNNVLTRYTAVRSDAGLPV